MQLAGPLIWSVLLLGVAAYCAVVGVLHLRKRAYVIGVLGIASAIVILTVPIQNHAVKVDLPIANP